VVWEAKRVTTDAGEHEADYLVIAMGADYDFAATPGFARAGTSTTPWPVPRSCATRSRSSRALSCSTFGLE